jgi:hypothetical protein
LGEVNLFGGVSKIEKIKYAHESAGFTPEKDCTGCAQQQLKNTDPELSSERAPYIDKPIRV